MTWINEKCQAKFSSYKSISFYRKSELLTLVTGDRLEAPGDLVAHHCDMNIRNPSQYLMRIVGIIKCATPFHIQPYQISFFITKPWSRFYGVGMLIWNMKKKIREITFQQCCRRKMRCKHWTKRTNLLQI